MCIRCLMCNKLNNCLPSERVCVWASVEMWTQKRFTSLSSSSSKKKRRLSRRKCTSIRLYRVLLRSCDCMNVMHGVPVLLMLLQFEHVNDSSLRASMALVRDVDVCVSVCVSLCERDPLWRAIVLLHVQLNEWVKISYDGRRTRMNFLAFSSVFFFITSLHKIRIEKWKWSWYWRCDSHQYRCIGISINVKEVDRT